MLGAGCARLLGGTCCAVPCLALATPYPKQAHSHPFPLSFLARRDSAANQGERSEAAGQGTAQHVPPGKQPQAAPSTRIHAEDINNGT